MLTVKHIGTDGVETIMEAERVERVQTGHLGDGIYLDREAPPPSEGTEQQGGSLRAFRHVFPYVSCRSIGDFEPIVWVMNQHGSTVATYRL